MLNIYIYYNMRAKENPPQKLRGVYGLATKRWW